MILWLLAWPAYAHDPGLSTATIRISPGKVEATLTFALADARTLLPPSDGTNDKSAGILAALGGIVASNFAIHLDGSPLKPGTPLSQLDDKNNLTVQWSSACSSFWKIGGESKPIGLLPRGHRQFLSVQRPNGKPLLENLLSAEIKTWSVEVPQDSEALASSSPHPFQLFFKLGVEHILTGYDHLLFLFGLLVVARDFLSAVKVVSCFTIAHSITLALATLRVVQISGRVVEPLIAATIVYVGVENLLLRDGPKGRWILTLAFGLIHGFGFATALQERGVGAGHGGIVVPLLSFNLGVEFGQIAVAAVLLPAIWFLKERPAFMHRIVSIGSMVVALLGCYWLVARGLASLH